MAPLVRASHPVIYYVRHGLTDWNVQQRLQGRLDVPLNAEGCAQAACCGEIMRDLFAREGRLPQELAYVSSPLARARRTMEIMRVALGLPESGFLLDPRLVEIAFGEWEGMSYADVIARDGDVVARREADKWGFKPPGGESYAQLTLRLSEWYETLERDTVVAAHGGTARALIAHLAIAEPDAATHYAIDQGVVYVLAPGAIARYG
ncbi:MAG: histidine phosphatase family protein [Proteobacteria bacterium]|nr:MAG: histidine phosphatase family protein [Pseudomonadota bacterium]